MNNKKVSCTHIYSTQCPAQKGLGSPHVGGKMLTGAKSVFVNVRNVVVVGSLAQCQDPPDMLAEGAITIIVEKRPLVRQ